MIFPLHGSIRRASESILVKGIQSSSAKAHLDDSHLDLVFQVYIPVKNPYFSFITVAELGVFMEAHCLLKRILELTDTGVNSGILGH